MTSAECRKQILAGVAVDIHTIALRAFVHRVAFEPVGDPEATASQILEILTAEARVLLAR